MSDEEAGGRIFFSSTGRSLVDEDEIVVLSVGVDIGSSTSHLVFSRIVLERLDSRYVVTERESFYQSDILLTPYSAEETIDADALRAFIERQYKDARIDPDEIDTGALILTGVTSLLHFRLHNVDLHLVGALVMGSVPGGLLGSYLSTRVPVPWLRRILCAVLLATGARMLMT